jgi:RNA polymerase sigma-70 factor (ECF subfamily)
MATDAPQAQLTALLARCALRDQSALALLYALSSPKLFGVALRIVRREDWAEDVLQECYLRIWHHAPEYRAGLASPMTWMTSIVRNRCLDWLRRPSFEVADVDGALADATPSADEGPYARLERSGEAADIADCLKGLDARQRQAIVLAFYDGLSHAELASHLREPLGTVKTWVRRGLLRLKTCLEAR